MNTKEGTTQGQIDMVTDQTKGNGFSSPGPENTGTAQETIVSTQSKEITTNQGVDEPGQKLTTSKLDDITTEQKYSTIAALDTTNSPPEGPTVLQTSQSQAGVATSGISGGSETMIFG